MGKGNTYSIFATRKLHWWEFPLNWLRHRRLKRLAFKDGTLTVGGALANVPIGKIVDVLGTDSRGRTIVQVQIGGVDGTEDNG